VMVQAHEATVGHNEDDGGGDVVEAGAQCCGGPWGGSLELSSHVLVELRSGWEERERDWGHRRGAASDLDTRVCRRESPPWLPLGRVEREGVETAAPTMVGEWWRE
jgi:hypothetical protein